MGLQPRDAGRTICAALQSATAGPGPVLLRREIGAGHGPRALRRWVAFAADELLDVLHEIADIDPANALDDESYVEGPDVDSCTMAEVIASLEDRFDFSIPEPDAATLSTVGDTVAHRYRRLVEQSDV